MSDPKSIAVDGPVASGKSAVGRLLAGHLGWRFLDTGVMYRAVTWVAIRRGVGLENEEALTILAASLDIQLIAGEAGDRLVVDGQDITAFMRHPEVEAGLSLVSKVSGVRSALVKQQRAIAEQGPIVMVGRDIGTVVLPDARLKVFLNASVEVRARRRHLEAHSSGRSPGYQQVVDDLMRRDKMDSERADSPLRPAEEACQIETDNLEVEEVAHKILSILERR